MLLSWSRIKLAVKKLLFSKTMRHKVLAWREHCLAQEQWISWKAVYGSIDRSRIPQLLNSLPTEVISWLLSF